MAKNSEGDEPGVQLDWKDSYSWKEQIENYNNPYRPGGSIKYYRKKDVEDIDRNGLYFCPTCRRCYQAIGNPYTKKYSSDHYEDFPSYKKPRRECTVCASPDDWYWGCLGGMTDRRAKKL